MKNFISKTLLKNLDNYKIVNKASGNILYLPSTDLKTFMNMQISKGKISYYRFTTPAERKAERVANLFNYIVLASAVLAIVAILSNTIKF